MAIGNKILKLRKQNNLSQERLAEKMGVARQTISKWELGETSPDLEQSKQLSQIFNVSLDALTNNDIKNVIISKVSNTEKLTKIIINILKITLLVIIMLVVILVSVIFFKGYFDVQPTTSIITYSCIIDEKEYTYKMVQKFENPNAIDFYTDDNNLDIDTTKYSDVDILIRDIQEYVSSRGGRCDL